MHTRTICTLLAFGVVTTALAADATIRPGRWEVTAIMDFGKRKVAEGMPFGKPMTSVTCISEAEAKQASALMPPPEASCKLSDYQRSGRNIRYTMRCEDVTVQFDGILESPDAYSATSVSWSNDDPGEKMTMKLSGKRTADRCSAKELAEDAEE
jgi:hypothetical protein